MSIMCGTVAGDTVGDDWADWAAATSGVPLALSLLLSKSFKAPLLLMAQVEERLVLSFVEGGNGPDDLG